jgi:hypothetical protein
MMARSSLALAVSALLMANVAQAGPIFSGPAQISSLAQTLVFDLLAGGDLDSLDSLPSNAADYNLQVISVVWSFDPPPGGNGVLEIGGTLGLAGVDSGLTFSESIDMSDDTGNVVFSQNDGAPDGLPFSETLAQQFLDQGGKLFGGVVAAPGTEDAWNEFFAAGGKLTNYLFVEVTFNDTNQIPEPAAALVWAGVGGLGLLVHRWRRRRKSA